MKFTKAQAYGNDFIYIEEKEFKNLNPADFALEICNRRSGVGADGLVLYSSENDLFKMRLYNSDGGKAEISGNGLRGLAAVLMQGLEPTSSYIIVETDAGKRLIKRTDICENRQTFKMNMGKPDNVRELNLQLPSKSIQVIALDIGNPHCVVIGEIPKDDEFFEIAPLLEKHSDFANGSNVEFIDIVSPAKITMRIWERGAGPTQSSGTGTCAAFVAASHLGKIERSAEIVSPGGSQTVCWDNGNIILSGWAELICEGEWLKNAPK